MPSQPSSPIAQRLTDLRRLMGEHGLDCYLVFSADEHQNEYTPPYKRRREAISGFTGSAGDVAVCLDEAHLFVDSRYHLQAGEETDPTRYHVHRMGAPGELDLSEWIARREPKRLGLDPFVTSLHQQQIVADALSKGGGELVPVEGNLVDRVWRERLPAPRKPIYALPGAVTGESAADKLARVRAALSERGARALVLSKLDDVAWLTNLRGADIPYNPVFEAYAIVEPERMRCFTDDPVPDPLRSALKGTVEFNALSGFPQALREMAAAASVGDGGRLWLDRSGTALGVRRLAGEAPVIDDAPNPVTRFKAIKNPVEIVVSREAHLRSGAAKVRSFSRLESRLKEGIAVSEADYAALLQEEYAREEGFAELSFNTIAAHGANGAIVHYGTPSPDQRITSGGMLLVDSGVQILGATTDDTRTIAVGQPQAEQRSRYTGVLRAHIRLAMQIFPEGTTGQMLDALARSPLWNEGLDYGHGTGHGVGAFLNVHEGPASISARGAMPLVPGMIQSNEPGYYRAGWGGIRLENLYVVEEALGFPPHPGGKRWLRLSPLTLIPFDPKLIEWERLAAEEQSWLAGYHRLVWENLSPRLGEADRHWLAAACRLPNFDVA
jgi:Xaa-Pro aminopeptidase